MLLNRRQALLGIGFAAFHSAARSLFKPFQPLRPPAIKPLLSAASTDATTDARLSADLARLAPRVDSEEGIPVFLACVNLVPNGTTHAVSKVTLGPLSPALASAFHRDAEAYQRIRTDAKAKDVATLIEVLADRDFSKGETTERS